MGKRTTLGLLAVAAGLLAFILLFERHTLSSGETEGREGRLLTEFVRDRVTKIVIERQGARVELVRGPTKDGSVATWKLVSPVAAEADSDAVDSLLGTLEWADARRALEGVDGKDRARFGLERPRIRASFAVANERIPLVIGGEDPQRGGVYAQLGDPSKAYVVGKDVFEALDHDASHFRSKRLFPALERSRVIALTLRGPSGERSIERMADTWRFVRPEQGLASVGVVAEAIGALEDIRATRFIDERPRDVARYQLAEAIVAVQKNAQGKRERPLSLLVGAPCASHEGERYARANDGPVVCVLASDVRVLAKVPDDLREKRLVTTPEEEVDGIEVAAGGRRFTLQHEGAWKLVSQAGGREATSDAAAGAVEELLASFGANRPRAFVPVTDRALAESGLSAPNVTFTVHRTDERPPEVLRLARRSGSIMARRGDEGVLLELPETAVMLIDIAPVQFRSRRLLSESEERVRSILIARGRANERVERTESGWRVTAPTQGPADEASMRELLARVAHLEAERFVAEQATPAHGLSSPRIVVTAHFADEDTAESRGESGAEGAHGGEEEHGHDHGDDHGEADPSETTPAGPRDYVIKVGAPTDGGAFAQLGDDPAVWVMPAALVSSLERSLTQRP